VLANRGPGGFRRLGGSQSAGASYETKVRVPARRPIAPLKYHATMHDL